MSQPWRSLSHSTPFANTILLELDPRQALSPKNLRGSMLDIPLVTDLHLSDLQNVTLTSLATNQSLSASIRRIGRCRLGSRIIATNDTYISDTVMRATSTLAFGRYTETEGLRNRPSGSDALRRH